MSNDNLLTNRIRNRKLVNLSETADIVDSLHKTPIYSEKGIPMVRVTNIHDGFLDLSKCKFVSNEIYLEYTKRYKPKKGDIVLTRVGSLGRCCYVTEDIDFCLGQNTITLIPKINNLYLYYVLQSNLIRNQFKILSSGTSYKTISLKKIRSIKIPICDKQSQEKIAIILSNFDYLIENNHKKIKILEEIAQLIYHEWFVKYRFPGHEEVSLVDSSTELGLIPEGWEIVSFYEIAEILSGGTPSTKITEYWNGDICFFTPKDVKDSFYVIETEKTITKDGLEKCNSKLYPKDTVFITARGTVGNVVMPSTSMAMNQTCYALIGKESINQYFLFFALRNKVDELKKVAHGAVFDTIIIETFKLIKTLKPSKELFEIFTKYIQPIFDQILNYINLNQNLYEIRNLLLPKLISGQIDVSELDPIIVEEEKDV